MLPIIKLHYKYSDKMTMLDSYFSTTVLTYEWQKEVVVVVVGVWWWC